MKTPMQELLEWVNDYPTEVPTIHKSAVIAKAKELLEKEKEAIINAYNHAYEEGWDSNSWQPEQYYNETFNTKETCTCKSAQFTREVTEDFEPMCGRCGRPI